MVLKPQDVVIILKLILEGGKKGRFSDLAQALNMSASEIHSGIKRLAAARLVDTNEIPVKQAVEEFLVHGVKYAFPAVRGGITRGMPTGFAAPPLNKQISQNGEMSPVWPSPKGTERGYSLEPLYPSVPETAAKDKNLYELLALVDAIRDGSARERQLAENEIRLKIYGKN